MISVVKKTQIDPLNGGAQTFYHEWNSLRKFRRILGGLAWPGVKPGFAVVLGEEWQKDYEVDVYHLHWLAEVEEVNIERLLEWCSFFEVMSPDVDWQFFGDVRNKPAMSFWFDMQDKFMEKRRRGFSIVKAPYADSPRSFQFLVNNLWRHLTPGRKTLHLGAGSKLAGYLTELAPEEIVKASEEEYPAIAALGYAVATLSAWPDVGLPY